MRMQTELNEVSPATCDIIASYFGSVGPAPAPAPAAGARSGGGWEVLRGVAVGPDGLCSEAGGKLEVVDLEEAEW